MTIPAGWLDPALVAAWLKIATPSTEDAALLAQCAAAAQPPVESARPDQWVTLEDGSRVYTPDDEVRTAAVMLAARIYRRRNSPGGMDTSFDQIAYVSRFDPEIERALRQGRSRKPAVDGRYTTAPAVVW